MPLSLPATDASHGFMWSMADTFGPRLKGLNTATPASTAWPAANESYLIPFLVAAPVALTRMWFLSGTTPGTTAFDLGIYSETFALLRSIGATSAVNTTDVPQPSGGGAFTTSVTLPRGRYYMAMSSASTALTVRGIAAANQTPRATGMFKMASAHPLPTTFVPASMGTTAFVPFFGAMTAAGTIL